LAFAIVGIAKQKGGSVGSSGHHNDRTRDTPNADPERLHLNRVLLGDDRNVSQAVDRIIEEHGGKPRSDSVETVEFLLTASPEWFDEPDPEKYQEKVERFTEQAVKFLEDPRSGGLVAKVVLHLDERTPHVQGHKVPIDPNGKLNAKHYFGGRAKMRAVHDLYAEYMEPLGLERGKRGSRARHETLKRFYGSVEREVELKVDPDRLPDPPRVFFTAEAAKQYKLTIIEATLRELKEPVEQLRHQAMLTRDERAHRVEADKRAEAAERRAETRVEAVERTAQEKIAAFEIKATDYVYNVERTARTVLEENRELRGEMQDLRSERNHLNESLIKATREKLEALALARTYSDRLTDIPMPEVMQHLNYPGEQHGQTFIYRGDHDVVAMRIEQQRAFDSNNQLICRNSLDLVVHLRKNNEGREQFNREDALQFLVENFGAGRAAAAYTVNREQAAITQLDTLGRASRGLGEPDRSQLTPERGRDSGSRSFDR